MPKLLIRAVAVAVVVLAVFSPALRNGFVGYDDGDYVTSNPHVNTGLTRENVAWAFRAVHVNNWHPLTWLSHAADSALFGLDPRGHHLTSVLLHAATAALLLAWLESVGAGAWLAAFVALGFGLHPLRVESVAWVSERKDVLAGFFWMLTLIGYTAWVRRPSLGRYLLTCGALAAGLLSKQMLVTLPVILLILDRWPLRRADPWRKLVIEKLPLFAVAAAASVAAVIAQRTGGALSSLDALPLGPRLANAVVSGVRYLGKIAWPVDLSVFYPFPAEIATWKAGAALVLLAAITAAVVALRRTHPWLAAGWAWYVIALIPVSGIVQIGMQSMADRYTYIPATGLLIALAWEAARWRRLAAVAGAALLVAWSLLTWRQIPVWRDGVTLFTQALRVDADNFVAHSNLGVELDRRGQFDEALAHYRETLRIKPGDRNGEANFAAASFARGERLITAGRPDEALAAFREGLRYRPRHAIARTHVARILTQKQQIAAALAELQAAIEADPAYAPAHMARGVALSYAARPKEARSAFEDAVRLNPSDIEARFNLGIVIAVLGDHAGARRQFRTILEQKPDFSPAREALAELGPGM